MTPDRIMQITTGGWASAVLGASAEVGLFDHLEEPRTAGDLAAVAKISPRGAQALLDGLLGLGFVVLDHGKYRNALDASAFLVTSKPGYLGGLSQVLLHEMGEWARLADVVRAGRPPENRAAQVENPFWEALVPAIANLSVPSAELAVGRLGLAKGEPTWLDVGGGSGIYSKIWLSKNPKARGVQLDWPNVNGVAKRFVGSDRFSTIDGDFHTTPLGGPYDVIVYSHIAHQETPESNRELFRKFRVALKPAGTLLVNDFILEDDRHGHPFAGLFASNMLLFTQGGASWRKADYREWLDAAGFTSIEFVPTPGPATLVFAR